MNDANNPKSYSAHIMIHLNDNDGGGVKTVSEALHCAFTQRGVRVSYLCDWDGSYARELQANGLELYICNFGKVKSQSWQMMSFCMPDLLARTRSFPAVRYVQQQLSEPWKLIWKCRKTRLNRMRFLKSIQYCLILSKLVYVFQRTNYWIVCLLTKRKFP